MPGKFKRDEPEKPDVPRPGREQPPPDKWIRKIEPQDLPTDDTADTPTEDSGDEITNDPDRNREVNR